ncbi:MULTISPECIES: methyltransferase [Streptomyces]|uniref:Putative O-methyltransferase n=1 Tax=Streptomyces albus (strain ATCC 21838 / DSM 41398 / FERM P-419 / JCM 4703 / NBRC 107858) TaxID=1081613 RepID=A0A0B5F1R1_STRA4|nr:methyltransferase [Streptomyces sp. SCSIO ZS0520]AJE85530.1 putative O-methyltransferase [Streptomyces albus]AOU79834.1 putative O-methyltransferase [Streptomyces albus]
MPKLPPAKVVRAVEGVRAGLVKLTRLLAPPPFALLELSQGSMVTQALYVAAELKVADELKDGPLTAAQLAQRVGADPESLHRLLRLLATYSVFEERADGSFKLKPMGQALRSDTPQSMRATVLLMGHPTHWEEWAHLVDAVRTGEASLPKLRGMGAFEFIDANPEYGEIFTAGMGAMSETETLPLLAAYDFRRFRTIVDYGAGRGGLLAAALQQAKDARGVLFDARIDTNGAADYLREQGVADRCTLEKGGLFDPAPAGGDAYLLKHIVHDWPEEQVIEILRNVRKVIDPDGRILLMEFVTPDDKPNKPHPAKLVDLWLMLLVGGKERSEKQYAEVLAAGGFRLEKITETAAPISVIEARPV